MGETEALSGQMRQDLNSELLRGHERSKIPERAGVDQPGIREHPGFILQGLAELGWCLTS